MKTRLVLGAAVIAALVAITGTPCFAADITVFTAEKIITMDPSMPVATAVAVRGDRIVAVGSLESLKPWLDAYDHEVVDTFKDKIVLPGFIDNHLHPIMAAMLLPMDFVTPHDWNLPGRSVKGVRGREAYLERLCELEREKVDPTLPLFAWGYHHLFHGDLSRADLDDISSTRPIIAWHRSFHEIYANTAALEWMKIAEEDVAGHEAIDYEKGRFFETGLLPAFMALAPHLLSPEWLGRGLEMTREVIHRGGLTTIGDMATGLFNLEMEFRAMKTALDTEDTPFRTYLVANGNTLGIQMGDEKALALIESLPARNTEKLSFLRAVKLFADGAFFSQLMVMGPPGYIDGHQGEWLMTPERLEQVARMYWNAGYQIHVHANGDEGIGVTLDVLPKLLEEKPRFDHRFSLHHYGYSTTEQAIRAKALGATASANIYYLSSMGDMYSKLGLGPDRASQIVRAGSLVREGVPLSFHSDFTMAPAEPLLFVSIAATRKTAEGNVMAPEERLTVEQALRAVTIDAAYCLKKDHEIGSIAAGKKADFTILGEDPFEVPAERIRDIPIWGTVFEGIPYPVTQ